MSAEKKPEPFGFVSEIEVEVSDSREVAGVRWVGSRMTRRISLSQGADADGEMLALHARLNEMNTNLLDLRAEAALAEVTLSAPERPDTPPPADAPATQPAVPQPTTEDGTTYRDLKVTPTCFLQRVVTNNGTHKCNAFVKPLTVHGVDTWEEPLDAFAGTADWRDWPIGKKVLLSELGVKTVRILCKPDGRTPIKVYSFLKE